MATNQDLLGVMGLGSVPETINFTWKNPPCMLLIVCWCGHVLSHAKNSFIAISCGLLKPTCFGLLVDPFGLPAGMLFSVLHVVETGPQPR